MFLGSCKLAFKTTKWDNNVSRGLFALYAVAAAMLVSAVAFGGLDQFFFGPAQAEEQGNLVVKRLSLDGASLNMW